MHAALFNEACAMQDEIIRHRRFLHANAETGFKLEKTRAYITEQLRKYGLEPQKCGRCGVSCTIGQGEKTFLLRADMDALPMREESGLPFAAQDTMHACGHDMHAAMLLGAAQLLKTRESALPGGVKLMFQPAEETLQGAKDMIDAGILENPRVDAAMMIHVLTGQKIAPGAIIIPPSGVSAPAAGTFSLRLQGRGAHGAMPEAGADPINAAAHIILGLQAVNARELSMNDRAALTIGMVQAGAAANVIPDSALLKGSFRAFSENTEAKLRRRIREISEGTAKIFGVEAHLQFENSCPALVNDAALCALAEAHLPVLLGKERIFSPEKNGPQSSGSEDFSHVSRRVPSLMLALAAGHPDDGHIHPLHHPKATFDERALPVGAAVYAGMAMAWLGKNG